MPTTKKPRSWFVQKLIEMDACKKATRYAKTKRTFSAAWRNCTNPHWRRWLLTQLKFAQHDYTVGSAGCPLCRISEAELNQRFPADRVAKALRKWKA